MRRGYETATTGGMRERFQFFSISEVDGPEGATRGAPALQFEIWAQLYFLVGGEQIIAARLQSQQPAVLTIRQSQRTRQITTDWECQHVKTGITYNIRTITDPDMNRDWFDLLIQSGVAA